MSIHIGWWVVDPFNGSKRTVGHLPISCSGRILYLRREELLNKGWMKRVGVWESFWYMKTIFHRNVDILLSFCQYKLIYSIFTTTENSCLYALTWFYQTLGTIRLLPFTLGLQKKRLEFLRPFNLQNVVIVCIVPRRKNNLFSFTKKSVWVCFMFIDSISHLPQFKIYIISTVHLYKLVIDSMTYCPCKREGLRNI